MDDQRSADPLTLAIDREIDREIDAALMVGPSPEFLARVRARITSEPAPSTWRLPWVFAATGALAIALVIAVAVIRVNQTAPARQAALLPSRPFTANSLALVPTIVSPRLSVSGFRLRPGLRRTAVASAEAVSRTRNVASAFRRTADVVSGFSRTEPEVLIDAREATALRRVLAGAREGRVDLTPLPDAVAATVALRPVAEIVIPLISVEPLAPASGEGVRQ